MRWREFITLLGGAALASPATLRAQQPVMPVIGWLSPVWRESETRLDVFRQGLAEAGFVDGRNVAFEYRWAEGQNARLPALAAELAAKRVNVIIAGTGDSSA